MSPPRHPVPVLRSLPPARRPAPLVAAVARRMLPAIAASAGALIASLAAERAMARLLTVALGRAGQTVAATPFSVIAPGLGRPAILQRRIVVIETVVIERTRRRR